MPRDAQGTLPAPGSSHRWQKWGATQAVTRAFAGVATDIATETGVRLGTRQVEQIVSGAAQAFDALYAQPGAEDGRRQASAKPMQGGPFAGKGVVRRPEALRDETRKQAEARAPKPPRSFARQAKSPRKRMATVAGIYSIQEKDCSTQPT